MTGQSESGSAFDSASDEKRVGVRGSYETRVVREVLHQWFERDLEPGAPWRYENTAARFRAYDALDAIEAAARPAGSLEGAQPREALSDGKV